MATIYDNFSGNLSNWIQSSAAPVDRVWYIQTGLLKTLDPINDKFGLIRYKDPINVDGRVIADYYGMDLYNGTDNFVVLRYSNSANFVTVAVDPGQSDARGVGIQFNTLGQVNDLNVVLRNSNGVLLSNEISPNKTIIPTDGILDVTFLGNKYDVVIKTISNAFVASGSYIDLQNRNLTSGYVGFGHSEKWNANLSGWGSICATDFIPTAVGPNITSFMAGDYNLNLGETTDITWIVNSGTESTSVLFLPNNDLVDLMGGYIASPSATTTYTLSAWSSAGVDVESFIVTVSDEFPIILDFTNNSPISASQSATLTWNISAATSAVINNGIGWITPYTSAGSVITGPLYNNATYTISAYDNDGDIATASTNITVQQLPTAFLSAVGAPTCSGSTYRLEWGSQYGTSAYLDNGIGQVPTIGTYTVTATTPKSYTLNVVNDIGQVYSYANSLVYYRAPFAVAGPDQSVQTFNLTAPITFDGSGSYDVENLDLSYEWYDGFVLLSTSETFTSNLGVGVHVVTLKVTDTCGFSSTDTTIITVKRVSPPVAIAKVDKELLSAPGTVVLDGTYSYDIGGYIASYKWYDGGVLIGNASTLVPTLGYGVHIITLVVTDNDGLEASAQVTVTVSTNALPIANAGDSQSICSSGVAQITLDGSDSLPPTVPTGSHLVWYEWDLSSLGVPNQASTITNVNEISATFNAVGFGNHIVYLTVSADTGFIDTDSVQLAVNEKPTVTSQDVTDQITAGEAYKTITLSATTSTVDPTYHWSVNINGVYTYYVGQIISIDAPYGSNYADVYVVDNDNSCQSSPFRVNIDIENTTLNIIDFSVDPFFKIVSDNQPITDLELTWEIYNATEAGIIGVGPVDPINGTVTYPIPITGSVVQEFILTATNGIDIVSASCFGNYIFTVDTGGGNVPISTCKLRPDYVITYGLDELKYDKNRNIDIVSYLPEYIRQSETEAILSTFETYLNTMFKDQKNYTWEDQDVETIASYSISGTDYQYYANTPLSANTPADDVVELYISDDTCVDRNDSISILDKINRLTDLLNPDLIPIDLIQNYTDNLGFVAGFNRNSSPYSNSNNENNISNSVGFAEDDLRERRYLRFMARNLPEWYQIKTTSSSIAIMLYSFGLIGNFSFYYTQCYSDPITKYNGLCAISNGIDDGDDDIDDKCKGSLQDCFTVGNTDVGNDDGNGDNEGGKADNKTSLSERNCCIHSKFECYKKINGVDPKIQIKKDVAIGSNNKVLDWVLTGINDTSLNEDLSPVKQLNDQYPGYFATPHFKLLIDLDKTTTNLSVDARLQKSLWTAVDTVRPINTVFEGVGVVFNPSPAAMYFGSRSRIRKSIVIQSEGTFSRNNPIP